MNIILKRLADNEINIQEIIDFIKSANKDFEYKDYTLTNGDKAVIVTTAVNFSETMNDDGLDLIMDFIQSNGIATQTTNRYARGNYTAICNAFNISQTIIEQDYQTQIKMNNPKYVDNQNVPVLEDNTVQAEITFDYTCISFGFVCSDRQISVNDVSTILQK